MSFPELPGWHIFISAAKALRKEKTRVMRKGKPGYGYLHGLRDGIPIALGYLSVSFGFGITSVASGLTAAETLLISMTCLTSAGQVAGVSVIAAGGAYIEMILAQLIINLRYALMGIALTQKLSSGFSAGHRFAASFGITDEVFGVAASKEGELTPRYMYGLITTPYIGWALGTLLGAVAGQILPPSVTAALGIAIYAMFVAIVVTPAKENKGVLLAVLISVALSCAIYYLPFLSFISGGFSIIICAVAASLLMAWLMPAGEEAEDDDT